MTNLLASLMDKVRGTAPDPDSKRFAARAEALFIERYEAASEPGAELSKRLLSVVRDHAVLALAQSDPEHEHFNLHEVATAAREVAPVWAMWHRRSYSDALRISFKEHFEPENEDTYSHERF